MYKLENTAQTSKYICSSIFDRIFQRFSNRPAALVTASCILREQRLHAVCIILYYVFRVNWAKDHQEAEDHAQNALSRSEIAYFSLRCSTFRHQSYSTWPQDCGIHSFFLACPHVTSACGSHAHLHLCGGLTPAPTLLELETDVQMGYLPSPCSYQVGLLDINLNRGRLLGMDHISMNPSATNVDESSLMLWTPNQKTNPKLYGSLPQPSLRSFCLYSSHRILVAI